MSFLKLGVLVGPLLCFFVGCPTPTPSPAPAPSPSPTPPPRPITPDCTMACSNLHALGCVEGADEASCENTCSHMQEQAITPFDVTCMKNAKTTAAAKKCPSIQCDSAESM